MGMTMNSDLTPDPPGVRDSASGPPGIRPHWRDAVNLHAALFADTPEPAPAAGEVWSIRHPHSTDAELVLAVITAIGADAVTVVPLSSTVEQATEWDLVLPIATLGYPAIVQARLAGTVAPERLERRLSALMPESRRDLQQLLATADAGRGIPPEHLPVGPWVLSEHDPRLAARTHTARQLAAYLTLLHDDPISEWQSLGSILTRGSRATGIELATVLEQPRWADRLQADQLNPFAMLPARKMAQLLHTLRVGWTERVRNAMYRLAEKFATNDIPSGTVLARRQGTRARRAAAARSRQPAADKASEYVDAVERELRGL
jgi:hypothetical protein